MNSTSPCLRRKPRIGRRYNSFVSNLAQIITARDEIHKFPYNIRKSMKLGKHRQSYRGASYPYPPNNKRLLSLAKYRQNVIIARKGHMPAYEIIQHEILLYPDEILLTNSASQSYAGYPQTVGKFLTLNDRLLYEKKKLLSPIKTHLHDDQYRPIAKVTFLNISKLELVNMYPVLSKEKKDCCLVLGPRFQSNLLYGTNSTLYSAHPTLESQLLSPNERAQKRMEQQRRDYKKNRPFVVPFERYWYKDFLWKIAFSNRLTFQSPTDCPIKFKAYIGPGNNSLLVKSLIKRRNAWWTFTDRIDEAHLVWTQIKVNDYFQLQKQHIQIVKEVKNDQYGTKYKLGKNINQDCQYDVLIDYNIERMKYELQNGNMSILNDNDIKVWNRYWKNNQYLYRKISYTMCYRNKLAIKHGSRSLNVKDVKIHNHLPNNYVMGNKKAMLKTLSDYYALRGYYVFYYLPMTFHVQDGLYDPQYLRFLNNYYERARRIRQDYGKNCRTMRNIWIVKPGYFTNRGNGIIVCLTLEEIKKILKHRYKHDNGNLKTYIIQEYLYRPLLYHRRKFDIRHYMMISSINGCVKGYWYDRGYIRTTSAEYTLKTALSSIHLTNDAVQKYLPDYGKYYKANKVSYEYFQKYLERYHKGRYNFFKDVLPIMKKIATDAIKASALALDKGRLYHNFEIFGMDFMIDEEFRPWLIEINTNPCLELACPLLAEIIPYMLENALKICLDSIVVPPADFTEKRPKFNGNCLAENQFHMVYDSVSYEEYLVKLRGEGKLAQDGLVDTIFDKYQDEVYEDNGIYLDD